MTQRDNYYSTSRLAMLLFRLALVVTFVIMIVRLYQLQIVQGSDYRQWAGQNRFRLLEVLPQRGVIYDRKGQILIGNRPSFEVALVPADLPYDDLDTEVDEEAAQIEEVLRLLNAHQDGSVAIRIGELMLSRLGRDDFSKAVEGAGIALEYKLVGEVRTEIPEEGGLPRQITEQYLIPDITQPLPLRGLTALIKRLIQFERLGSSSKPVPIFDSVNRIQAFDMSEESYRLPSVRIQEKAARQYVYGELLSHILGFMGPIPAGTWESSYQQRGYRDINERVGLNGLEYQYQERLRGIPGYTNVEVDILGQEVRTVGAVAEPVPGSTLRLHIDLDIQRAMQTSLQNIMDEKEALWGSAIAMNPQNGAVLGLVSLPSYDNNVFAERIGAEYQQIASDERRPLINYAIGGLYPPGSTYKLVTAAAALHEGVISPNRIIEDRGPIFLPNKFYPDDFDLAQKFVSWNHAQGFNHGPLNIVGALAVSNDIYFYWIGGGFPPADFLGLGQKKLSTWSEKFGYGGRTGIDLPGEVGAIIPDDQWKRQFLAESWTTGDSYNMAIGQGFVLSTPLQVLVSTVAVANGGTVYIPQIVDEIIDAQGGVQQRFIPKVARRLDMSDEVLAVVREGMWAVVNTDYGTGTTSRVEGVTVAGKTGTAEFCEYIPELEDCRRDHEDNLPTHAWFTAFAPYENPEIAVVAFVYDGGEGSEAALPVVRMTLDAYFKEQVADSN